MRTGRSLAKTSACRLLSPCSSRVLGGRGWCPPLAPHEPTTVAVPCCSYRLMTAKSASSSRPASAATAAKTSSGGAARATSVATRRSVACSSANRAPMVRSRVRSRALARATPVWCASAADERSLVLGRLLRGADDEVSRRAAVARKWERPRPARFPEPNGSTGRTEIRDLGLETSTRAHASPQAVNRLPCAIEPHGLGPAMTAERRKRGDGQVEDGVVVAAVGHHHRQHVQRGQRREQIPDGDITAVQADGAGAHARLARNSSGSR